MKPEIKERITQIQNGIVPEGHKKTDFGIFPEDWEQKTLGEIFDFFGSLSKSREELGDKGMPYLHYGDMHRSDFKVASYSKYLQLPKYDMELKGTEAYLLNDGDVAFLDASEDVAGTTRSVLIDNPDNLPFLAGLHTFVGKEKNNVFYKYYKQYLTLPDYVRKQIMRLAAGFKVYGVNRKEIGKVKCFIPSKPEQEKIADILEKWDKAIALQEQHIDMLTIYKRSLINQLFKPRNNWQSICMDKIFTVRSGYAFKSETYVDCGKFYIITIANVKDAEFVINKETATIDAIPSDIKDYQRLKPGDILISLTGNVARVCKTEINNALLNQRVGKIEVNPGFDAEFVYYLLQTYKFVEYMKMFAQGAAQDNLSIKDIYKFRLNVPIDIDEQRQIRGVLQSIDINISLQKQKLEALKQQQKSMQQLLLTGIVRV